MVYFVQWDSVYLPGSGLCSQEAARPGPWAVSYFTMSLLGALCHLTLPGYISKKDRMSPLGNWDWKGPRDEPPLFNHADSLGRHPELPWHLALWVTLIKDLGAGHSPAQTRSWEAEGGATWYLAPAWSSEHHP